MPYLHSNETLRSRLDELLSDARGTQNDVAKRALLDEASVVAMLLRADEDAAFHAASLGDEPEPISRWHPGTFPVEAKDFRPDWLFTEAMVRDLLQEVDASISIDDQIDLLKEINRSYLDRTPGDPLGEVRVYPFHDDPRIDDSIVYGAAGAEATPHLPAEQMPATDPDPATEFEFDTTTGETDDEDLAADFIYAGTGGGEVDPDEPLTAEEVKARQAPKAPADGFKKLQTKTKGKASK